MRDVIDLWTCWRHWHSSIFQQRQHKLQAGGLERGRGRTRTYRFAPRETHALCLSCDFWANDIGPLRSAIRAVWRVSLGRGKKLLVLIVFRLAILIDLRKYFGFSVVIAWSCGS